MSFSCWKAISSPPLNESQNTLRAFNGFGFKHYGALPSLSVTLEGKTIHVEVEVFDTPLDYNLLLGRSWVDSMHVVVSNLFCVVQFYHQGKVVTVDQLAFQIQVVIADKRICRMVVDEGASTCVMSFSCWKAIGSPPLTESKNTLRAFNGSGFKPYGVLPSLPVTLEGKTVQIEVEVFDTPLDYNLLLGRSWVDSMRAVVSTLFRVLHFPHQGKVVTVDQLAFFNADTRTGNVPFIANTPPGYENVGVGLLKDSSLMGTFPIPPQPNIPSLLVASINMISRIRDYPRVGRHWKFMRHCRNHVNGCN